MANIKQAYIAGGMMSKGEQMQREAEKRDLQALGIPLYVPQDNKDINDKANLDNNDGLAEKIVKADTDAIRASDVIVIEPQPFAMGTMAELGQIKGMKDVAKDINAVAHKGVDQILRDFDFLSDAQQTDILLETLSEIASITEPIVNQKVFPHFEDVRRFKGATESEDRRSFGVNQYIYGLALDLTDGKGFYEWDEILEELEAMNEGGE